MLTEFFFFLVLERDFRLTGVRRAQSDKAIAPEAFKTSSWWKVSVVYLMAYVCVCTNLFIKAEKPF